jgi:hypothetical protein
VASPACFGSWGGAVCRVYVGCWGVMNYVFFDLLVLLMFYYDYYFTMY